MPYTILPRRTLNVHARSCLTGAYFRAHSQKHRFFGSGNVSQPPVHEPSHRTNSKKTPNWVRIIFAILKRDYICRRQLDLPTSASIVPREALPPPGTDKGRLSEVLRVNWCPWPRSQNPASDLAGIRIASLDRICFCFDTRRTSLTSLLGTLPALST
jgi:hypothetical protein